MHDTTPAPLRVLLGGDVMLGRLVDRVLAEQGPTYPFAPLAAALEQADLFVANLECALCAASRRYCGTPKAFYFRGRPSAVQALQAAGVDLVTLANNHALDAGSEGLRDTLATLERHGIATAGAGRDLAAASAVRVLALRGRRIGVLAACDHQPDFAAGRDSPGIHYLDLRDPGVRRALVARVGSEAAAVDDLIVSLHWMSNWVPHIPAEYRMLARALLEAGARIVWGHSPHHFLGSEWHAAGVALYSTGDLIDDYAVDPHYCNDRQLLHRVELDAGRIVRLSALPLALTIGRAEPADEPARRWIVDRLRQGCRQLDSRVAVRSDGWLDIEPIAALETLGA